ncbi:MAG: helix-turn-helix transcriptional regulator [Luteolibacter sp.]
MKTRSRPAPKSSVANPAVHAPRDGSTRRPIQRIYEIHAVICKGGLPNCSTLAERLGVTRKTIQRDINFMRDSLGLPLVYCEDLHGYRYDGDVSDFPVFQLSEDELATLFFTRSALRGIRGTRVSDALSAAFAKLTQGMLGKVGFTWNDLDEAFSRKAVVQDTKVLGAFGKLAKAVLDQREISFLYRKLGADEGEVRAVQPLHLGEVEGGWYLIAHDLDRAALRTFALPRISNTKVMKGRFERSADFDGATYLRRSFGVWNVDGDETRHVVRVELRQYAARLAQERRWHPTQEVKMLDAKGNPVEVRFEVGRLEEVVRWVLSFGRQAKAIAPPELVRLVRDEVRAMQDG